MPVIGYVDPRHKAREADLEGLAPPWLTPEELLQESRFWTPKQSVWTHEMIAAAIGEQQDRDYISTTMLVGGCPRSKVLERKEEYISSLDGAQASLWGTLIHRTLENTARPGSIPEARFFTTVGGVELSCSPDLITAEGELYDYKFVAEAPPFQYPWRNHTLQVMYNAYIVRNMTKVEYRPGHDHKGAVPDITSCTLMYITARGTPKPISIEKMQDTKSPNGRDIKRKLPYVWTDEEVEEGHDAGHPKEPGLFERVEAMREALDIYPKITPAIAKVWGGSNLDYRCPGKPYCSLPNCLAKSYPDGLKWDRD